MTSTSAPFSFHCVICIESFDLLDRPPVVLPCGHTFLCEPCSKRIDKCMECRTPLYIVQQKEQSPSSVAFPQDLSPAASRRRITHYNRHGVRTSPTPPSKQKPIIEKIPIPIARNLVLISLMEMANKNSYNLNLSSDQNLMDDSSDSSLNEDQQVLDSIDTLNSCSGTYCVREQSGLPLYKASHVHALQSIRKEGSRRREKPLTILEYGQKLQIVDVHDDMYTLARNEGVVFANSSQLVKVGVAKERSCKLEGMINSIQLKKNELSQRMNDLLNTETKVRMELDNVLRKPVSHPIIEECPEDIMHPLASTMSRMDVQDPCHEKERVSSPSDKFLSSATTFHTPTGPRESLERRGSYDPNISMLLSDDSFATPTPATPTSMFDANKANHTPRFKSSSPSNDYAIVDPEPHSPFGRSIMCGAGSLIPLFRKLDDDESLGDFSFTQRFGRGDESFSSAGRSQNGASKETVDFRTGFSGHAALGKTRKNQERVTISASGNLRNQVRTMGDHRGISSSIRRPFRSPGQNGNIQNSSFVDSKSIQGDTVAFDFQFHLKKSLLERTKSKSFLE